MQRLIDEILSFRGDQWRPFAIEISQDEIRVAVYGGAKGFDEPATAETASHDDLEPALLEALGLLEHSRLLSPSRAPYHRGPHHRCVFIKRFDLPDRHVTIRRRCLLRQVPRIGEEVSFGGEERLFSQHVSDGPDSVIVGEVIWRVGDDEIHLWDASLGSSPELVARHLENGWQLDRELSYPSSTQKTDP